MELLPKEKEIITKYKDVLLRDYEDQIQNFILYGSKARGDANKESDIDILITLTNYDWKLGDKIRRIGYELDEEIEYKFSIIVLSESEFENQKREKYQFAHNVIRDGVMI